MKEDTSGVIAKVGPDLLVPPHILSTLIELLGGDSLHNLTQQEQMIEHLSVCHYCRTAIVIVLNVAQEYDRRNNESETPSRDLLARFASISREIEACKEPEYELMGAYAETIIAKGREEASKEFPTLSEHIKRCRSCQSTLNDTLTFLSKLEEAK